MRAAVVGGTIGLVVLLGAGLAFLFGDGGRSVRPATTVASAPLATQPNLVKEPGYPRPLLFRSGIEVHAIRGGDMETAVTLAAKYDLVIVKALDEEILDRAKVAPYLREIKQRSPNKIVLDHYDLQSHHPTSTSPVVWPGHWLLLQGTTLLANLGDAPGDTTLTVANGAAVRVGDDLQVTALDATGKPDYSQVEQMQVLVVNGTRVTVERAAYGSKRVKFEANRARVAAHARVKWNGEILNWHFNFCREAPRDPGGRRLIEALAESLASYLQPGGPLAGLDGYQFDVQRFTMPAAENGGARRADCDADGVADSGYVRGVNSYGLGVVEFQRTMRRLVGDRTLLISEATGEWSSRDFAYANGIENESFPDLHRWDQFSSAYQRYQYWRENAREPRLSYLQLKETTEAFTRCAEQDAGTNWKYRLALGTALLGDGYFAYMSTNEAGSPQCNYIDRTRNLPLAELDELLGADGGVHYLGAPRGDAQRIDLLRDAPDLLPNGGFEEDLTGAALVLNRAKATITRDATNAGEGVTSLRVDITELSPDPEDSHIQLRMGPVRVTKGREYTLRFRVRADPGYGRIDQTFTGVTTRVAFNLTARGSAPTEQDVMADGQWRAYSLSFVAAEDDAQANVFVLLGKEAGSVWLDSVHLLPGAGDVFARRFERGAVVVNGSTEPAAVDLAALFPGMTFRRLRGTQDAKVNNGESVQGIVRIPGRDASILVSR